MSRPLGEQPLKRWKGLRAGRHQYRSNPEDPGQLVDIQYVEGHAEATVLDGEDAGLVLLVREMGGTLEGPLPSAR